MAEAERAAQIAAASPRLVQLPLLGLAAAALAALPFVTHARNRLLSGQPVGFLPVATASPLETATLPVALLLILLPAWRDRPSTRWFALFGVGLALQSLLALAAAYAVTADESGPAARTSLGAGFWAAAACLLLLASDVARPLRRVLLGVLIVFGPLALALIAGVLDPLSLLREYAAQHDVFWAALLRHVVLVVAALVPALLLGVPLGIAAQRRAALRRAIFPVLNLIQTIPSIALFGLLIGPLSALGRVVPGISGVGLVPALIALVLYSLLPIVRNTVEGLDGVPTQLRTAAAAMGLSPAQTFLQVEAALGLPVLLSGLRVTAVQAVGLAAVSALIGAGGLGAIIFQGLFANALDLVLLGALPVIALAVLADFLFRLLTDWSRQTLGAPTLQPASVPA